MLKERIGLYLKLPKSTKKKLSSYNAVNSLVKSIFLVDYNNILFLKTYLVTLYVLYRITLKAD